MGMSPLNFMFLYVHEWNDEINGTNVGDRLSSVNFRPFVAVCHKNEKF